MHRCLHLAQLGQYYVAPNPMVGAVLTDAQGNILAEGWHEQYGGPHAEVNCLAHATKAGEYRDWKNATLYVNLEPCSHYGKTPPCAKMIVESGIGNVVVGCLDPNPKVSGKGIQMLQERGVNVTVGILEKECRDLNKRFICLHEQQRPYVILKWAQTQNGFMDRIRTDGQPITISTPLTKQLVHQQRAQNMAILVGTRTALLDNPSLLTTRWSGRHPIRLVVDKHHVLNSQNKIFSSDSPTIVYDSQTDWSFILHDLASRNIHSVLVEGGACLLKNILSSGLYDEIHIEVGDISLSDNLGVEAPRIPLQSTPKIIEKHLLFTEINKKTK